MSRRTADKIEFVFVQIKKDGIPNYVSIMVTRNKLLSLIHLEILIAIYAQVRQQFERVWTLDIEIRHVVRLVEQSAALLPGALFIPPVSEFGAHHWKGIGSNLRITQPFHRAP